MISVNSITKSFGTRVLIENGSFTMNKGEKIGLVGRNGTGKTTLFKMILGEEHPDSGNISFPKGYRTGHLEQHIHFTKKTVLEEASQLLPDESQTWRTEKILSGLGFSADEMYQPPEMFSGGYQIRINLAKVLSSEPDLLLLDEPGNYLDVVSIRWLTGFLKSWKNELLLITHDRGFMDSIITHTVGIHRKSIRKIEGDTEKYYNQIIQDEEIYEKTRLNDDKKRKDVEAYIARFKAKATLASRVKSRKKLLQKQEKTEKLSSIADLEFEFNYINFEPKSIMQIEDISFGYSTDNLLVKDLKFEINKSDRVAIIGKNGKGKTTLLKILNGDLTPQHGTVKKHSNTAIAYFEQTNISRLDPTKTVEEEIDKEITDRTRYKARNIAGGMMFEGDDALKKIGVLSGGEKSRVLLGTLLCKPSNILLLDEPTNHFDMQACDSILEAIEYFSGAVVLVTHNEMFLHAIPNKFIVFDNDKTFLFNGTYQDFLDTIGWDSEKPASAIKQKTFNTKEMRKQKAEIVAEKSKKLKPATSKIEALEKKIEIAEATQNNKNDAFQVAILNNSSEEIKELSIDLAKLEKEITKLYEELEQNIEEYDKINSHYNQLLENVVAS